MLQLKIQDVRYSLRMKTSNWSFVSKQKCHWNNNLLMCKRENCTPFVSELKIHNERSNKSNTHLSIVFHRNGEKNQFFIIFSSSKLRMTVNKHRRKHETLA